MTFQAFETSRFDRKPFNLVLFEHGDGPNSYIGYTDFDQEIVHDGKTYTPVPLNRGEVTSSGTLDKSAMKITLPVNSALGTLYGINGPSRPVAITIRQGHVGEDSERPVVWIGRVVGVSKDGPELTISGEPFSTSMKRPGLRRNWQYGCPHVLYGSECRANKAAVSVSVTLETAPSDVNLFLPTGWTGALAFMKFHGGLVEWTTPAGDSEARTIFGVGATQAILNMPVTGLDVGSVVSIAPGCNHRLSDCTSLHRNPFNTRSNARNFGGFPWIPKKNPIGFTNQYY